MRVKSRSLGKGGSDLFRQRRRKDIQNLQTSMAIMMKMNMNMNTTISISYASTSSTTLEQKDYKRSCKQIFHQTLVKILQKKNSLMKVQVVAVLQMTMKKLKRLR